MSMFNPPDFSEEEMKEFENMTVSQYAAKYLQPTDKEIDRIVYSTGQRTPRLDEISAELKSLDRVTIARTVAAKSFPFPNNKENSKTDDAVGQVWESLIKEAEIINRKLIGDI